MKLVPSPSSAGLDTCADAAGANAAAVRTSARAESVMRFMVEVSLGLNEFGVFNLMLLE